MKTSEKDKPKNNRGSLKAKLETYSFTLVNLFLVLQIIGLNVAEANFPIPASYSGFVLLIIGVLIGVSSRLALGSNWTTASEYQVKKGHQLITTGIYKHVRHPIYLSFLLIAIGVELMVSSYLILPIIGFYFAFGYLNGKREEKILKESFGREYERYMQRSKMIIPFIF